MSRLTPEKALDKLQKIESKLEKFPTPEELSARFAALKSKVKDYESRYQSANTIVNATLAETKCKSNHTAEHKIRMKLDILTERMKRHQQRHRCSYNEPKCIALAGLQSECDKLEKCLPMQPIKNFNFM